MFSPKEGLWKVYLEPEITFGLFVENHICRSFGAQYFFLILSHSLPRWGYAMGFNSVAPSELKYESLGQRP